MNIQDEYTDIVTKSPVVIDNGSGSLKAGFAGAEKPNVAFTSLYSSHLS
jgi:centractin